MVRRMTRLVCPKCGRTCSRGVVRCDCGAELFRGDGALPRARHADSNDAKSAIAFAVVTTLCYLTVPLVAYLASGVTQADLVAPLLAAFTSNVVGLWYAVTAVIKRERRAGCAVVLNLLWPALLSTLYVVASDGGAMRACTALGCENQLTIHFDGALPQGQYDLQVDVGSRSQRLTFSVPFEPESEAVRSDRPSIGYNAAEGYTARFRDTPHTARVRLRLDTEVVLDDTVEPEYYPFRPNGADCPPLCLVASLRYSLSKPLGTLGGRVLFRDESDYTPRK